MPLFDRQARPSLAVFGMNRRNRDLVSRLNPPGAIRLAKSKIDCKRALLARGLPVPEPIADIHTSRDAKLSLPVLRARTEGFVVKPCRGAQGRGIVLFSHATNEGVFPLHGRAWSIHDFLFHICRILSGEYSSGLPLDSVIVEERLRPDEHWIAPELPGAPDLRIIVHLGRAVFAMARLPTIASEGKANLHRGGVGLGIDLGSARSVHAIWKERPITRHPDSGVELIGREVSELGRCLTLAEDCARAIPLGYMGVDIMLDRRHGPCVLEVNARPGLAIQLANGTGLAEALPGVAGSRE